jgi:alkanesulfonate monooxygenase SsuD/methylene tetrahydromethanopterin reductase-like flavin-dependent oxidoreductase (luciferase family)
VPPGADDMRTKWAATDTPGKQERTGVKFSNFLFPESRSLADDGRIIRETFEEACVTDRLGYDVIWLAEHHFDGICAYVDPVAFSAALAVATKQAKIGFAVAQMALHHPIRFAEQMSMIDQLAEGRIVLGLGRGTAYNVYDYQGYGIDPAEAQDRFEEAEMIMRRAWAGGPLEHEGRFFQLKLPELRPAPFTKPHPPIIRAAASEHGMLVLAERRQPFMMNVQSDEIIAQRMLLYRETAAKAGAGPAEVERLVDECWIWRNIVVAETDAEAERIAVPAFLAMNELRAAMRDRVIREQGVSIAPPDATSSPARTSLEHGLVRGSPETVAAKLRPVVETGVGGMIIQFRLGTMSLAETEQSLRLFKERVVPLLAA